MIRNYADFNTQLEVLLEYLQVKIAQSDWHGVADVAMDIREMQAAHNARRLAYEQHGRKDKEKSPSASKSRKGNEAGKNRK